jgi:hypothetical protein
VLAAVGERAGGETRRRAAVFTAGVALAAAIVVLVHPDLRYALVELNLGTRSLQRPPAADLAVVALVSLLPLVILLPQMSWSGADRSARLLLLGGLIVAVASLLPFEHYWSYALLAVPGLTVKVPTARPAIVVVSAGLALLPLAGNAVTEGRIQAAAVPEFREAAAMLAEDPFVYVGARPYLTTWQPGRALLRAPTMIYLVAETSRTAEQRSELPRLLAAAHVLADDGILEQPIGDFPPEQRAILDPVRAVLADFSCVERVGAVTLRFRPEHCPIPP